jgi:quinoprotein glucose dehydrogenase
MLSVDNPRGMVFVPLTSPSYDTYGGDRPGDNLFGNTVLAINCQTGERVWHFQAIHHDLWDYDFASQPALVTVKRGGDDVPAVAQVSKQGFVYLLHRQTGNPLFEIKEQPVMKSDVPASTPRRHSRFR